MAEEKKIVLTIETITDQAVMDAYGKTLKDVLGTYEENIENITKYNEQLKKNTDTIKALQKEAEKNGGLNEAQVKTISKLTAENNKLNAEKSKLIQVTKNQEKVNTTINGSMENQSQLLGKLRMAWRKMTDEQKAANEGMLETIQQLDAHLKQADANVGNYQRNVGNYGSAFNPLRNQINMLVREMPSLANSVSTFFMAISNNLPMFADEVAKVRAENKRLAAEGKPTVGVVSQIVSGLFSWQTALIVVVSLLAKFGGAIAEFISDLTDTKDPMDEAREAMEKYNEAIEDIEQNSENLDAEVMVKYADKLKNAKGDIDTMKTALKEYNDELQRNTEANYQKKIQEAEQAIKTIEEQRRNLERELEEKIKNYNRSNYNKAEWQKNPEREFIKSRYKDDFEELDKLTKQAQNNLADVRNDYTKWQTKPIIEAAQAEVKEADKVADEKVNIANKEAEKIAEIRKKASMAMAYEITQDLLKLDEEYAEQKALFEKHGEDTTVLTEVYEKRKFEIFKKYQDKAEQERLKELTKEQKQAEDELQDMVAEMQEEMENTIANDPALKPMAESALARFLGVSDEELGKLGSQAEQLARDVYGAIADISMELTQRRLDDELDAIDREAESEKAILEGKLEKGLISQKEYEKKLAELDEETKTRREEANKEAFEKQKGWNIGEAIMNAALAITKTFAEYGGTPIAWISSAMVAASTAAQIATIATAKYARGGELHGASHAQGGIKGFVGNQHIEAEGGEVIINKRSSAKHRKLLSLINSDNGWGDDFAHARGSSGRFFARGGVLGGYDFRTAPLPDTSGGLAKFAQQQTATIQNAIEALNKRIDNIRVYLPLSDIEQKSNEKRVHISRAVL